MKRAFMTISALAAVALTVSGCSPRSSRIPDTPVKAPDAFVETAGEALPSPGPLRWWESFGDERLNVLIEEAFEKSPGLIQAYERTVQAKERAGVAGSARFPTLNASASGGRVRQLGVTADSYRLSGAASYEIDLWRRLSSRTRAAELEARATVEDYRSIRISVAAELADLYYLALEQRAQVELADRTIEAFEETLSRVESRYREGLVPALDVYQSRENLAGARAGRPVFEANLAAAEHAISILLGRVPGRGLTGQGSLLPEAPEFNEGLPSELLTRRPDVRAAFLRIESKDRLAAAALADRFPSFNLAGEYGGASPRVGEILDSPNIFWNMLVSAAMPVIDGGRRRAEHRRAEAEFREYLERYHETVLVSLREVEDALSRGRATGERIEMLEERVAASESSLRLALERYLLGLSDYLPVLTEQQRSYEARSALLAARRGLISERIALVRALGGGLAAGPSENKQAKGS